MPADLREIDKKEFVKIHKQVLPKRVEVSVNVYQYIATDGKVILEARDLTYKYPKFYKRKQPR